MTSRPPAQARRRQPGQSAAQARTRQPGQSAAQARTRQPQSGAQARTRQRRRRSDGERSREAILHEAARLATVEGIEGLSLARLADAVGMSKSGLFAHFGSKEELQLATVDTATTIFTDVVIDPAREASPGVPRLFAYAEQFLAHVRDSVFPGGCFFASVAAELDTHPGPVRDRAMAMVNGWLALLEAEAAAAREAGEIDPSLDAAQLAFELNSYLFLANTQFVVSGDRVALERAQRAVASRLAAARPGT